MLYQHSTNAKSHACPKATPNATLHMVHQLGDLFSWDALGKIFEELQTNELVLGNNHGWNNYPKNDATNMKRLPFLELGYKYWRNICMYLYNM